MSKGSSMVRSALLLTAANLAMRGVSMVFQIFLTGQVGAAGIGLLQLIMTVHAFAITVGTSGIRVAAMYLSAQEYGLRRFGGIRQAMVWCIGGGLLLSTLVGLGLTAFAETLAISWVKDLRAAASLRLLGLTLPLTCLSSILAGYFTACNQVFRLVAVEIGDRVLTVGLTVWLLQAGVPNDLSHACVSIVGGGALASVVSVSVLLVLMLHNFRKYLPCGEKLSMGKRLVRLCVPVAFNDYLRSGLSTLEHFLIPHGLTRAAGNREAALQAYGTVHGMVFPILMFPSTLLFAVSDLLVPALSRCQAERNRDRIRQLTGKTLQSSLLYAATAAGLLYVLSEPLGLLFYDSLQAGRFLRIFAPMVPMLYLDCITDGMHKGLGQQLYCVRLNTVTALLDVLLLFLLLPRWGIGGFVFSFTVTHGINFYYSLRRLLQISGHTPSLRKYLLILLCVFGCAAFTARFVPTSAQWISLLLSGGVYLALLALLFSLTGLLQRAPDPSAGFAPKHSL